MDQVAVDRVAEYAGEDADATWRIEAILAAKVREEGLWTLYAELERPLIAVLARHGGGRGRGRRRAAQATVARIRRADRRDRDRGVSRWPAGPSTSTRGPSFARCSSTS